MICFDYRICTIGYFLDEMSLSEVNMIIQNVRWLDRNDKEMDRYKLFVSVQANSKKKVDIEELLPLPWDEEMKNHGTKVSKEEAEAYKAKMKELEERIVKVKKLEQVDLRPATKYTYNRNG